MIDDLVESQSDAPVDNSAITSQLSDNEKRLIDMLNDRRATEPDSCFLLYELSKRENAFWRFSESLYVIKRFVAAGLITNAAFTALAMAQIDFIMDAKARKALYDQAGC